MEFICRKGGDRHGGLAALDSVQRELGYLILEDKGQDAIIYVKSLVCGRWRIGDNDKVYYQN